MTPARRYYNSLIAVLGGIVILAWGSLWWLSNSPWSALVHVHGGGHVHLSDSGSVWLPAAIFVAGWTLMVVAMMLPSTFPLIEIFRRLVRRRNNATALVSALLAGYLIAWTLFGLLVYGGLQVVGTLDLRLPAGVSAGALFLLAGAFQFSSLKYRCMERCRTPLAFVLGRWRGHRNGTLDAFRIGSSHGIFCVGCCWALMLLMFAFATVNLLWMLALGLLMAVEKNARWGGQIGTPVGVLLLVTGGALLIHAVAIG